MALGSWLSGLGFRVLAYGFQHPAFGFRLLAFGFPVWKRRYSLLGPSFTMPSRYLYRVVTPLTSTHYARDRWTINDNYTENATFYAIADSPENSHLPPVTGWRHGVLIDPEILNTTIFVEKSYLGKDDMGKLYF